jgi:glycosyltransferase involved in cell wall biosynthesis
MLRVAHALHAAASKQFPSAKAYLWCHDLFGGERLFEGFHAIAATQTVPIVVSDWHKQQMYEAMRGVGFQGNIPARRIYNPIEDNLTPDSTPVDTNKLVFFSSPHKGLEHTLKIFDRFKEFSELKDMRLVIANPGYFEDHNTKGARNVDNLGAISHPEVIKQVRSAFAVFHLNNVFPETFGLVHAECNAVGTPFLSSYLGATPELVDHPQEVIDVTDYEKVIKRMIDWKKMGRPKVRGSEWFRMRKIVREWEDLLSR